MIEHRVPLLSGRGGGVRFALGASPRRRPSQSRRRAFLREDQVHLVRTDQNGLGEIERRVLVAGRNAEQALTLVEVGVGETMVLRAENERDAPRLRLGDDLRGQRARALEPLARCRLASDRSDGGASYPRVRRRGRGRYGVPSGRHQRAPPCAAPSRRPACAARPERGRRDPCSSWPARPTRRSRRAGGAPTPRECDLASPWL